MWCINALHHFSVRNGFKSGAFFDHFRLVELNGKLPYLETYRDYKGGPEPLEKENHEFLGSKHDD